MKLLYINTGIKCIVILTFYESLTIILRTLSVGLLEVLELHEDVGKDLLEQEYQKIGIEVTFDKFDNKQMLLNLISNCSVTKKHIYWEMAISIRLLILD